jgi:starch phosphorylase
MSNPVYSRWPSEILGSDALAELALDLRWSYNHAADEIWSQLEPELWDLTHNPWLVLQTVSQDKLQSVASDADFLARVDALLLEKRQAEASPAWFQQTYPDAPLRSVAYFSMEFMLSEALPIYAGGLGNVAGDQLKAASNLGVPVIGVGLLYQQGYFRQEIDSRGQQHALYPYNDPGQLPVRPLREPTGEWLRLQIALPGSTLWVRAWQVRIGRRTLYLLDTNDPANVPADRGITSELYGGGAELRLKQELVLGIGGWRLLRAMGVDPEVCHLNEGHAAFAVIERARCYMIDHSRPFDLALAVTRAGNVFTTHTPVEAGFDRFDPQMMGTYFKTYAEQELAIALQDLLALGRRGPRDMSEPFNMAYLAIRGSGVVNGVSRLHGQVSRRLFQGLFPRCPEAEVPITHVTNGVHVATWDSAEADRLWEAACGKERGRGTMTDVAQLIRKVSDRDLWRLREEARASVVQYVRKRLVRQLASRGASAEDVLQAGSVLDPGVLTLGFARRFATYKRPNLLLHDPERLIRILTNALQPVQVVLAGKAHPDDLAGQSMIQQWIAFVQQPRVRRHVVFLTDYDMLMAERLVQGVDVWINTPRRPWEASGTSGMKVLVNGGLNLSELDGWWAEAYSPEVGWALGDGREHGDDSSWDAIESEALYALLEREVIPEFYARDERGIAPRWVARIRESMARLTPAFSANRTVREYTDSHYLPAAAAYRGRAANSGQRGAEILEWQRQLTSHWSRLKFGALTAARRGDCYDFQVEVYLDGLDPDRVHVELYAEGEGGSQPVRQLLTRLNLPSGSPGASLYGACISTSRAVSDYTARLVPYCPGTAVPLELPLILWRDA